jgi:hypothetical protein
MSELAIFIIGSIIFAITVYGSVIGGGIALGRYADADPDDGPVEGTDLESARSAEPGR